MDLETTTPDMLTPEAARVLTDQIGLVAGELIEKLLRAWEGHAWEALKYASWQDYCKAEFDAEHLALPRSERGTVVARLSAAGMSTRAIAAATNVSREQVRRDLLPGDTNVSVTESDEAATKQGGMSEEDDLELTDRFIQQTAQSIYRFAGTSSYAECVALREALQKSLKRLDNKIKKYEKEG